MSVGPFDISAVISRVKAQVPGLRAVGGAADLKAATRSPGDLPAAFVLLARETAKPKEGGASIAIQAITVMFSVVLAVRDYRQDQRGAAQALTLRDLIRDVRDSLMGWTPPGFDQIQQVDLAGGSLMHFDQATVWWAENFTTRYWSRK